MKRLILGGKYSGKLNHFKSLGFEKTEITPDFAAVYKLNDILYELLKDDGNPAEWAEENILKKSGFTVVCDELGCGIVPADKFSRDYREAVGRICCSLAKEANIVERVYAGIPSIIKDSIQVTMVRHGKTAGNLEGRYIGASDESLLSAGELVNTSYPKPGMLFVTGLKRTSETAAMIYPGMVPHIIDEMNECSFGEYEGKNYEELKNEPAYISWMESGGITGFPGGENRIEFVARCREGFLKAVRKAKNCDDMAIVCHGGTIMAVLSEFAGRDFYDWQVKNLQGYIFDFDRVSMSVTNIEKIQELN